VLVTVTASAVNVVVPVTVVSSVFVKGTVSVIVSRVSSIETTVDVLTATEVTVTVGMLRNDEQNSAAVGKARSSSTTGEISWHSVSLTSASPGISFWAELAAANERRSEVMEVRILIRGSDSGPIVDVCTCHW
jgi:hypothetical protein